MADAAELLTWRYPTPYDFYDGDSTLDPAGLLTSPSVYWVVRYGELDPAGFVCFGPDAQVPGGVAAGLYRQPLVDIGLGLHPSLTGLGLGESFVAAACALARDETGVPGLRLSVAAFNTRAKTVYERVGFSAGPSFTSPAAGADVEFLVMTRPASRGAS